MTAEERIQIAFLFEPKIQKSCLKAVLIRHPIFFYPGSDFFQPHKIVSKLWEIWSGLFIPDPNSLIFLPIPDPESSAQKGTGFRIRNTS